MASLLQTYTLVNYVKQFPRGGINLAELATQRRNGIAHGSATVLPFLRIRFLSTPHGRGKILIDFGIKVPMVEERYRD